MAGDEVDEEILVVDLVDEAGQLEGRQERVRLRRLLPGIEDLEQTPRLLVKVPDNGRAQLLLEGGEHAPVERLEHV